MLLQLRNIHLALGHPPLLDGVDLTLDPGERVALVGRNGSGKSTLMKIVAGEIAPDDGTIESRDNLVIARLEQDVPRALAGTIFEAVADGLGDVGADLAAYHELAHRVADDDSLMTELARVQQRIDAADGWTLNQQVEATLSRLKLDGEAAVASLSGGLKRRVLMARTLVRQPDLLLLDEPTNHLDIDAIAALEEMLLDWNGTLLFVTHDRAFLARLATRIVDLDRGRLTSWPGDYDSFLRGKAKALADEAAANAEFDRRLAEEEVWIRQGIKARRTRNEGRVRALKALRAERAQRRETQGKARLQLQDAASSGRRVILAENVSYAWDGNPLIRDFSTLIQRGDKVGILGPNGVGKSTLIRLLLGQLTPDSGTVTLGTRLDVAHFDQLRGALDLDATVIDNVGEGSTQIEVNGQPRHVISYLKDFLFAPDRARQPVRVLSGGERNRLLLAKLFTRPANLLVMDEPTNDLDVETLELLEERLIEYSGTLLLVSHDRAFIDNVVTSTLVFEGGGRVSEYVGGYSDWLRQRPAPAEPGRPAPAPAEPVRQKPAASALSSREQRELKALPAKIDALEARVEQAQAVFAEPGFYEQAADVIESATEAVRAAEADLSAAFERWEALEAAQSGTQESG